MRLLERFVCTRLKYLFLSGPCTSLSGDCRLSGRIVNMLVKLPFPIQNKFYPDVDMLRCKDLNSYATECVVPRRPNRCLPPLPEDKECSNSELKNCTQMSSRKRNRHRGQCLLLPAVQEYDES
ncbi:unnamed protein product [Diatraea saccharalis]|uniref:Uncharacterized protein n=1 Tax=Diatraea saccharalis TaxID=40085 RepID=A0A9N9QL65_9NEOP|nr:unnamed protein product [Diatraea saccharalis]